MAGQWPAMVNNGQQWAAMAGNGQPWPAMASQRWQWASMACNGWQWFKWPIMEAPFFTLFYFLTSCLANFICLGPDVWPCLFFVDRILVCF